MIIGKNCDEPALWDEVVHDLGGHPLQLWGWGELKGGHNWHPHRILFVDDQEVVFGAAQVLTRNLPGPFKRLNYIPRGPVSRKGSEAFVLEALAHYCRQHLPGTLTSIEPDSEQMPDIEGWIQSKNTILIPRTLILDLSSSEDDLLSHMTKKTRQYIRKSGREEGMTIRHVKTHEQLAPLLDIYKETARRANFPLHDDKYYYDVHDSLGESSLIFAAYKNDAPIAFVWLAASTQTAFELYGGMNEAGQQLRANYALKWHAITKCKEWGLKRYDMNGLLNDGVSTFKQGFANHETMLAGTYDYPMSPLYNLWAKGLPAAKKMLRKLKSLR